MAGVLQHLRSSTLNKRPNPASMVDGQLAINYASGSPGAFFKDTSGNLVKVGPVHVGSTAPNVSPASGGTAGNSLGEQWLDTSGGTYVFKIWDGGTWRSEAGEFVNTTGDTMTGALGIIAGSASTPGLFFTGDTNTGIYSPGADQVAISTGGTQRLTTDTVAVTSTLPVVHPLGAAGTPSLTFTGDLNTGLYSPGADQVAISTGGTGRLFINSSGSVGIGTGSPSDKLDVFGVIRATNTTDSSFYSTFSNPDGLTRIRAYGGGSSICFDLGTSEKARIDSSGRLLVGTASGTAKLDVFVTSNGDGLRLGYASTPLGGIGPAISFAQYNNSSSMITTSSIQGVMVSGTVGSEAGDLIFNTSVGGATAAERMRITSAGNVGIGTSTPQQRLQTGNARFTVYGAGGSSGTTFDNGIEITTGDGGAGNRPKIEIKGGGNSALNNKVFSSFYSNGADESLYFTYAGGAYFGGNVGIGTTSPGSPLTIESSAGNQVKITYPLIASYFLNATSGGDFAINKDGAERLRIDSSGRLLVGTSSASGSEKMIVATSGTYGVAYQPALKLINISSGGSTSSPTGLGAINWSTEGYDVANIEAVRTNPAGGTFSDLIFRTNGTNASTGAGTERMRINSNGYAKFANDGFPTNSSLSFSSFDQSINDAALYLNAKNASYTSSVLASYAERAASSAYNLATFYSTHVPGSSADLEFKLRGDGEAFADGSWTGGGADYAEYFEWSDSNPNNEDRRGISVILDGDKIREASAGEDPIGVISGNPSVVGDAAWNKWHDKHLRDDFGTYIQEDYEVEDEDGNTIVQQRRKLNPAYDPDVEYISREQRPEWDCVGLMGKLRIRKGQITGSRWIKMRDISDSIEEWLVR